MSTVTFRNRDGKLVDLPTLAATRFKNEVGAIFEQAALGGAVASTKHNTPKAGLCKSSVAGAAIRAFGGDYFNPDEAARQVIEANPGLAQSRANSIAWQQGKRLLEKAIDQRRLSDRDDAGRKHATATTG